MKIVAAIIGSGIGLQHFKAIQNFKGSKIKYICEKNSQKRSILKKKFPSVEIIEKPKKIFEDPRVNLVSIASYDNYHYKQVQKCIENKKHLVVEKPLCLSRDELKKIYSSLKKNKKIKMTTNLVLRCNGLFNEFRKKINLKDLFYIEADYIWGRKYKLFEWRSKIKEYSVTSGAAVHMIDLVIWLTKLKPTSVISFGNSKVTQNSKFKKNNLVISMLKFPKNINVKISANAAGIYEHFHEIKVFQKNDTLVNSRLGSFQYNVSKTGSVIKKFKKSLYPDKKNRGRVIQNFIKEILYKKKPSIKIKDQIDLMSICFAIEDSIKLKKEVKIKYL